MPLDYDPFSEALRRDPHAFYRRLRRESPVHFLEEHDCWLLSRFADIWREEQDHETYVAGDGVMPLDFLARPPEARSAPEVGLNLAVMDPPRHGALRSAVTRHFSPRAARALRDWTREIARARLAECLERGRWDVIGDYATRVSVAVASRVIGLPPEPGPWFAERVDAMFERDASGRAFSERAVRLVGELQQWLDDFVATRRRRPDPEPNALNALFEARLEGRPLSDAEVSANLSLMLVGGTETLPKVVAACVQRLSDHPGQRAEVVAEPALAAAAFHEALRIDMPTQALGRRVRREKEVDGQKLRPGQGVLFLWASANRDEREFPDPDRYDLHRNAPRILSFGSGAHMCLGAHVARMEGEVMLEELLRAAPDYEVVEGGSQRISTEVFHGFAALEVRAG